MYICVGLRVPRWQRGAQRPACGSWGELESKLSQLTCGNLSCFPHLALMTSLLNSEGLQPIPTTSAPMNTSLEHRCQDLKPTPQTHCRWAPNEQKQDPQVHWNLLTSKVTPLLAMSSHAFPQRPCWRSWSQVTHPTSASWSAFPGGMLPLLLGKNPSAFYLSSLSLQPLPPLNNNKHVWNQC